MQPLKMGTVKQIYGNPILWDRCLTWNTRSKLFSVIKVSLSVGDEYACEMPPFQKPTFTRHSQRDDPPMHLCPTQFEDITLQQQHVFSETKTIERKTFTQRSKKDECPLHLGLGLPCCSESPNRRRAPGEGRERERGT